MKLKKKRTKKTKPITGKWIYLLLLIVLITLGLFYYFNKENKANTTTDNEINDPLFKKEGELFFISKEHEHTIKQIDIEVASNDFERSMGLMYRRSMGDSLGMLFIFDKEEPQSFWMHNTYISLDIIYVNRQFEIVTIYKYTQPLTDRVYPSHKPAMYVVETRAGFCDEYEINEGDRIKYQLVLKKNTK